MWYSFGDQFYLKERKKGRNEEGREEEKKGRDWVGRKEERDREKEREKEERIMKKRREEERKKEKKIKSLQTNYILVLTKSDTFLFIALYKCTHWFIKWHSWT